MRSMAKTTIILTTHYLEAESLCRNIAIINHGIAGAPRMADLLRRLRRRSCWISAMPAIDRRTSRVRCDSARQHDPGGCGPAVIRGLNPCSAC